jgi:hypothetical protein
VIPEPPPPPPPPPPGGAQPSIQIQQITNAAGNVINPAAAAGQINFVLNVEPGDGNTLQSVSVSLDGAVVGSQSFSANRVPKSSGGVSTSVAPTVIIIPFDTRGTNAAGDRYSNTTHTATAQMTHSGGTASAAELELTFTNANIPGAITFTGNNAQSAGGTTWYGNDDAVGTCSVIYYDTPPSTLGLSATGGLDLGKGSGATLAAATTTGGDLVTTASGTFDRTDSDNKVELTSTVTCTLPATATGYDTTGDGVADITGGTTLTATLNLDNLAPVAPAAANYTFADARNTAPVAAAPVNLWGNGSTAFGLTGLDGGIGTLVATINLAVPVGSGADLGESASAAASAAFQLLVSALADGLGNATASTAILPDVTCNTCSVAFWIDLTSPAFSAVRPTGISVLRPDDGTFAVTALDVISDFTVVENLSGIDADGVGVGVASETTGFTVKRGTTTVGSTLTPVPGDGALTGPAGGSIAISVAGVSTVVQTTNSYTVSGQIVDQAGNVGAFPGTAFTVDITSPVLNVTAPPQDFNLPGAATAPANIGGDFTDENGIASAKATGFLGTCAVPVSQFTINDANIDVIDLGVGPTFAASYTLKTKGVGVTQLYSYPVDIFDTSLFIDGTAAGNQSSTCANQSGTW